jgi:hypothetical protein
MLLFERSSVVPRTPEEVYAWHGRPYAFQRVMAPWEKTTSSEVRHDFRNGGKVRFEFRLGPVTVPWLAEYRDVIPGRQFVDVQLRGPFPFWRHTHRFDPDPRGCLVTDRVEYDLPGGALGRLFGGRYAHGRLVRMFDYRHGILTRDLSGERPKPLRIAVTGSTGLVGSALVPLLTTQGHDVIRLVRAQGPHAADERFWDPGRGILDPAALEGLDAVVHLAGANVAEGRWNDERKRRILQSRVGSTKLLVDTFGKLLAPPKTFVCASAVGYYGNGGERELPEEAPAGSGFLADVCRAWEAAASAGLPSPIRLVTPRIGTVLSPRGGALAKLLPVFRAGVGAPVGRGYFPWVTIDDLVSLIRFALENDSLRGPVNAVAPGPLPNLEFSRILARQLRRPLWPAAPAPLIRLLAGELADALLLSSLRVAPAKALAAGFHFEHPILEEGLRWLLRGEGPRSS